MGLVVSSSRLCDVNPGCRTIMAIVMAVLPVRAQTKLLCELLSVLTYEKLPESKPEGAREGGLLTSWRGGGFP